MTTSLDYLMKYYRQKSKQVPEVFKSKWLLKVIDLPKKCDNCNDLTSPDGKDFIAIVTTNGIIFYFCSLQCLHEFVTRELEKIEEKTRGVII